MHLPALVSTLLLSRAQDPLANSPNYSKDKFPPYPSMTNADGSNITVENLRGTRLYGWKGCEVDETKAIASAFDDFYKLASSLSSSIDWAGEIAEDFWGKDKGKNRVPDDRRKQIQQIFQAQQQMYAIGWHLLPPYWSSLWIEVRCSGNDGTGDPNDVCKDKKPDDGQCGRGGAPVGGNNDNAIEAYADSPTRDKTLSYSRITFCTKFFNLPSLSEAMSNTHKRPIQLDSWDNRARVFLHETTHLDYFMNSPGSSPNIDDLQFDWREQGKVVRDWAYGPKYTKILRNYGLEGEVAFYPQRNADSYAWFAVGSYVKQKTGTYPRFPRPRNIPVEDPMNSGGGDVKAANANLALFAGQPLEDLVTDSTEDVYEYAEGFSTPKCPDVGRTNAGGSGSSPANPPPPTAPPAAAKTNALSIVFQTTLDEIGPGYDWLFFPGKQGEAMLCHSQKDSWHFKSKVGPNKDGIPPWPISTFHFENLLGRACDYKNNGQDNPGMLWCKEKNGKDVGIQCFSDNMRTTKTTKQCTKSGLIPSVEHVAVAYCEW